MTFNEWFGPESSNPAFRWAERGYYQTIWEAATAAEQERIAALADKVKAYYEESGPNKHGGGTVVIRDFAALVRRGGQ